MSVDNDQQNMYTNHIFIKLLLSCSAPYIVFCKWVELHCSQTKLVGYKKKIKGVKFDRQQKKKNENKKKKKKIYKFEHNGIVL